VSAKVGSYVEMDGQSCGEFLLPCKDWDAADFRWPNPILDWRESRAIACNVHVTGRTVQYRQGTRWVRCKIEFVGDGEPNTFASGWILFGWDLQALNTAKIEYQEMTNA
jgi:hypothetical protein